MLRESGVGGDVGGEFIVAAAVVLHERVAGSQRSVRTGGV